jgi:hypothetical protein
MTTIRAEAQLVQDGARDDAWDAIAARTPASNAACAAFTQPVRRYSPDRCWRTVGSLTPSSYAAAATEPARMYARRTSAAVGSDLHSAIHSLDG